MELRLSKESVMNRLFARLSTGAAALVFGIAMQGCGESSDDRKKGGSTSSGPAPLVAPLADADRVPSVFDQREGRAAEHQPEALNALVSRLFEEGEDDKAIQIINSLIENHPDKETLRSALLAGSNYLAGSRPRIAVEYASRLPLDVIISRSSAQTAIANLAKIDLSAAKELVLNIEDEGVRSYFSKYLLRELGRDNPEEAAGFLSHFKGDAAYGHLMDQAISGIVKDIGIDRISESLSEVLSASEDESFSLAIHAEAVKRTVIEAPEQLEPLLGLIPSQRDELIVKYIIPQLDEDHPPIAASYAESVHDPNARFQALSDVGVRWFENDPGAALSWVGQLGSEADKSDAFHGIASLYQNSDLTAISDLMGQIPNARDREILAMEINRIVTEK